MAFAWRTQDPPARAIGFSSLFAGKRFGSGPFIGLARVIRAIIALEVSTMFRGNQMRHDFETLLPRPGEPIDGILPVQSLNRHKRGA